MKVMALDFGSARTGVAVSDPTGIIARPLCVVERAATRGRARRARSGSSRTRRPEQVVVGHPLTLRGERGEQARETEQFATKLRERLEVPVVLFDERFTTDLAQQTPVGRAARGRARSRPSSLELPRVVERRPGVMPPKPGPPPRQVSRGRIVRRRARRARRPSCSLGLLVVRAREDHGRAARRRRRRRRSSPRRSRSASSSPRASRGVDMAQRVAGGREDRAGASGTSASSSRSATYLAATRAARRSRASARRSATSRASSSRRRTTSSRTRRRRSSCRTSSTAFTRELGEGRPRVRAEEEPDAVRRADHRVDGREGGARAGRAAARRAPSSTTGCTRGMTLGIDATIRYGLHVPRHEVAAAVAARQQQPVQHAQVIAGPAADADRESGARVDAGGRASGEGRLPLLRPQAGPGAPLLHARATTTS